jgi:Flp pilus assembly protein protease CpaA
MSEELRGKIYRVVTALLAIAAIYGLVNEEQSAAIASAVGALTALLASFNTAWRGGGDA